MANGPGDWVRSVLGTLPRDEPPDLSLDAILERGRRRRQRHLLVGGGLAAAATLLLAIAVGGPAEPPVHLDIQIVDVPEPSVDEGTAVAAWIVPEQARQP